MDIEIELHVENNTSTRRRIGTAVFRDIDPAVFSPYSSAEDFAALEHWLGVYVWSGWPASGRLVLSGRLRPAGAVVDVDQGDELGAVER